MGLISVDYNAAANQICLSQFPNKGEAFALHNTIESELTPDSSVNRVDAVWRGFTKDFPEVVSSKFHFDGRVALSLSAGLDAGRIDEVVKKIRALANPISISSSL